MEEDGVDWQAAAPQTPSRKGVLGLMTDNCRALRSLPFWARLTLKATNKIVGSEAARPNTTLCHGAVNSGEQPCPDELDWTDGRLPGRSRRSGTPDE